MSYSDQLFSAQRKEIQYHNTAYTMFHIWKGVFNEMCGVFYLFIY